MPPRLNPAFPASSDGSPFRRQQYRPCHGIAPDQAADLLNVSRPFLISLLEQGRISFRRVGNHRRVRFDDLMQYRRVQQQESKAAMADIAAEAQRLNLGY